MLYWLTIGNQYAYLALMRWSFVRSDQHAQCSAHVKSRVGLWIINYNT